MTLSTDERLGRYDPTPIDAAGTGEVWRARGPRHSGRPNSGRKAWGHPKTRYLLRDTSDCDPPMSATTRQPGKPGILQLLVHGRWKTAVETE